VSRLRPYDQEREYATASIPPFASSRGRVFASMGRGATRGQTLFSERLLAALVDPKLARVALLDAFRAKGSVLVAFSGGVDSAVLAKAGAEALGARSLALIVDSESYAREERDAAEAFAREMRVPYETVFHSELADASYAANPVNRCYFCRKGLGEVALDIAHQRGFATVAVGTNLDDLGDYRPGLQAIREANLWEPLVELGLTKADVRALAKEMGLPVWDKPSMACLSSRIPYGEAITIEKLQRVGRAEALLRAEGFRQVRVRTFESSNARVEVLPDEIPRLRALLPALAPRFAALGYARVEVDERGYRTGALNELLTRRGV
jgi:pyridinium-3,5-biscarboxylic acid mononucleotide sulfurtransferase